jgi:hypothetical protein
MDDLLFKENFIIEKLTFFSIKFSLINPWTNNFLFIKRRRFHGHLIACGT